MPTQVSYPGVYIEEISSGVRTISGVATSITAFIGRTLRGPVNEPRMVTNFGEFERLFGGLSPTVTLPYAVQDFFTNGGAQALIVRLYKPHFANTDAYEAELASATQAAEAAALSMRQAAEAARDANNSTPASVVTAVEAAMNAAPAPKPVAIHTMQGIVQAAKTEAARPAYMETTQKLTVTGAPTGGTIKLAFRGQKTSTLAAEDLIVAAGETAIADALKALSTIGAPNLESVTAVAGATNPTFLIKFAGDLANTPVELITVEESALTGGTSPNVVVAFPLPDAASVTTAVVSALDTAVKAALGRVAPRSIAKIVLSDDFVLEAASPGSWGNALQVAVDYDTKRLDDGSPDLTLFNLTIREPVSGRTERIRNVSGAADAVRHVGRVLESESSLVRVVKATDARPVVQQRMEISGGPTGGNIRLALDGIATGDIALSDLVGTGFEAVLKSALEGLAKIGAGNVVQVTRSGSSPNFSYTISLGGALTGPLNLLGLNHNGLTGGSTPNVSFAPVSISGLPENRAADSLALAAAADFIGSQVAKSGLFALEKADLFNLLCIPPDQRDGDTPVAVYQTALQYCYNRRAMLLVDPPAAWSANSENAVARTVGGLSDLGLVGPAARNAALFYPRIRMADPMRGGQIDTFVPCGAVAGVMARTDATRGVWKAPAGLDAALYGTVGLDINLSDAENGQINPLAVNALRSLPAAGRVVWGARTLRGADSIGDEYKYIPVRRLALFIEETLFRSTQWVVFEPNDEPLWSQIRLNVGAFLQGLFRQGAFQGRSPREAYFIKCDKETTTQNDINQGIVNIVVGFAPLKPAEFVVIKIQQIAGEIQT